MANASTQTRGSTSIWTRKLDLFYVVFLALSIFLAIALDLVHYLPSTSPKWVTAIYEYYIENYNDPIYVKNPTYFKVYVLIEVLYSIPATIWCIRGLVKDDHTVYVPFLVLATHMVSSTMVCLGEVWATEDWPKEDIDKNLPGYIGFLVIATLIWLDIFSRVKHGLSIKTKLS